MNKKASRTANGALEYDLRNFPLGSKPPLNDHHIVDLYARRSLIKGDDYAVGFDGNEAWIAPSPDKLGRPARFYCLGPFYLFSVPFVFADNGARQESLGKKSFHGKEYDVARITFDEGVGDSPEDEYTKK
jgi:hypothetical protein